MGAKIEKATTNVMKILGKVDDLILEIGTKIL